MTPTENKKEFIKKSYFFIGKNDIVNDVSRRSFR